MKKKSVLFIVLSILVFILCGCAADDGNDDPGHKVEQDAEQKAFQGYTLFTPLTSNT